MEATCARAELLRGTLNVFQLEERKTRYLFLLLSCTVYIGNSYFVNINARLTQEIDGSSVVCNLHGMLQIALKFHLGSKAFYHLPVILLCWEMLGAGVLEHRMSTRRPSKRDQDIEVSSGYGCFLRDKRL